MNVVPPHNRFAYGTVHCASLHAASWPVLGESPATDEFYFLRDVADSSFMGCGRPTETTKKKKKKFLAL